MFGTPAAAFPSSVRGEPEPSAGSVVGKRHCLSAGIVVFPRRVLTVGFLPTQCAAVVSARPGKKTVMGRRHAESIEVRRRDEVPAQFLWRSRLYVVKDVLEHWLESGRWWSTASATALAAGTDAPLPATTLPAVGASGGPAAVDDREREFWRVEARAGKSAPLGIYDLCFDWSRSGWQLVEVHD